MNSKKNGLVKNVIIINDFDYIQGGASKIAIETANLIADNYKNVKVFYFCAKHNTNCSLNDNIINVCTNQDEALKDRNRVRGLFNGLYNFKAKKQLKKLLNTLDPTNTIIHVHGWTKCLSSSIFSAIFKKKFKMVLTLHDYFTACPNGGYFNYKKNEICHFNPLSFKCLKCNCDSRNYFFKLYRIIRQLIQNKIVKLNKKTTNVIAISDFSQEILKKTLNPETIIHRINNPVDLELNTQKINYKNNEYYLYVGRISKEKGVDVFCQAVSDLNYKGIVVGDGPELDKLKKSYPNIKFVGWKNSSEVKEYMKKAKAFIFPSKWYETMGLTVIEALQYGIPVFVSSNTAAVEYVSKEYCFSNIDELKKIISNKNITYDMSRLDLNAFSKKNYHSTIIKLYNDIMQKK